MMLRKGGLITNMVLSQDGEHLGEFLKGIPD